MPSADQNLKIFLQVQADASELAKINTGLSTTAAEAEGAAAATDGLGSALSGVIGGSALGGIGLLVGALAQIPSFIAYASDEQVKWSEAIKQQTAEIDQQVESWGNLARKVDDFGDLVKLGDKIAPELISLAAQTAAFRTEELVGWKRLIDSIAALWSTIPGLGARPFADALTTAKTESDQLLSATVARGNAVIEQARSRAIDSARLNAEPVGDALAEVTTKIDTLKAKIKELDFQRLDRDPEIATKAIAQEAILNDELQIQIGHHDNLSKKQKEEADTTEKIAAARKRITDDLALKDAKLSGDSEAQAVAQGNIAYQKTLSTLGDIHGLKAENVALAKEEQQRAHDLTLEQLNSKDATKGTVSAHRELRDLLAAERLQLEAIKSQISSVTSNPFLTINEKDAQLAQLLPREMAKLNQQIDLQKSKIKGGALDPTQLNAARSAIQGASAEMGKLKIQLQLASSPTKQLQANLTAWVNSFGTTAQQIGQTITSTIGTAVSGVSNAITGAIFQTQSWGQAFAQVAQQIVGNIINIVLQWIEQQAVMLALHAVFGSAAAATSAGTAAATAAAWAPAATAASIATEGEADAVGVAALTSAMAAGQGIVSGVGLFEKGGYNPGFGVTHPGEYIIDKTTVRRAGGAEAFDKLRVAINNPSSGDRGGARSGSASGRSASASRRNEQPHVYVFTDREELQRHWSRNPSSRKTVIDWVNGAGGHLRS